MGRKASRLLTAILMFICLASTTVQAAELNRTKAYYDTIIKGQNIGKYEFTIEAHETPSNEVLPIIDKSYFPVSTAKLITEIDNTSPSALYSMKNVVLVDVVFAIGEFSQMQTLENYMDQFDRILGASYNTIDQQVTSVETVKGGFSMEDASAETIYTAWEQFPNPNNYTLHGDAIVNAVYNWNGYSSTSRPGSTSVFNQIFIEAGSWETQDFELSSTYAWHGCAVPSGFVFHWDRGTDSAYVLEIGHDVCGHSGYMLYKVNNLSKVLGAKSDGGSGNWYWFANYGQANGQLLAYAPRGTATSGKGENVKISMEGANIKISSGNTEVINYTDPNPIAHGGVGLWAGCTVSFRDVQLQYEKKVAVSLGEAISDVAWRDNSVRFVVHATDTIPTECEAGKEADLQYTISKLLNSNAYLLNLGNSSNKASLDNILRAITAISGEQKGTFISNTPIVTALDKTAEYIIAKARDLSKPVNYILVNTDVVWETVYNDLEQDLPLNFGEHDGTKNSDTCDVNISNSWGVALTHLFNEDKILAEKWRFRHFNNYYDNSTIQASFHNVWMADPIESFKYPGKYRINYKRKDNPFHPDVNLNHAFDEYRRWSEDYDPIPH